MRDAIRAGEPFRFVVGDYQVLGRIDDDGRWEVIATSTSAASG